MGAALPIAALGLSAFGTYVSMQGQKAQAEYQSDLAKRNAILASQNERVAMEQGAAQGEQIAMQGGLTIGKQRSAAGASGVDVQSGSVLDVLASTRFFNRLDLERTEYNARAAARGYGVQAENFESQSQMARLAGAYGQMSTLLTGAGQAGSIGFSSGLFPKFG